jgi:hypothetical protein
MVARPPVVEFARPYALWKVILTYVAGLIFYAFHFPECVWPGKFDYWGASHHVQKALLSAWPETLRLMNSPTNTLPRCQPC